MPLSTVTLRNGYFADFTRGIPLSNAKIYIGKVDLDPEVSANQLPVVFQQEDGTQVAGSQPVVTSGGGVPTFNGSPVNVLVDGDYSIKILNSQDSQIYYNANNVDQTIKELEQGLDQRTIYVGSVAELTENTPENEAVFFVGSEGVSYTFSASDLSSAIDEDFVYAPDSDLTGASGAFVRSGFFSKGRQTVFVDAVSGSDNNSGLDGYPLASISEAFSRIPQSPSFNLNAATFDIVCSEGDYEADNIIVKHPYCGQIRVRHSGVGARPNIKVPAASEGFNVFRSELLFSDINLIPADSLNPPLKYVEGSRSNILFRNTCSVSDATDRAIDLDDFSRLDIQGTFSLVGEGKDAIGIRAHSGTWASLSGNVDISGWNQGFLVDRQGKLSLLTSGLTIDDCSIALLLEDGSVGKTTAPIAITNCGTAYRVATNAFWSVETTDPSTYTGTAAIHSLDKGGEFSDRSTGVHKKSIGGVIVTDVDSLLDLGVDRPWHFEQDGTGATSSLRLRPRDDSKKFRITPFDGSVNLLEVIATSGSSSVFVRPGLSFTQQSSDPNLFGGIGVSVVWQSDGTGSGDDGDIMMKIRDSAGVEKVATLIDFSALT